MPFSVVTASSIYPHDSASVYEGLRVKSRYHIQKTVKLPLHNGLLGTLFVVKSPSVRGGSSSLLAFYLRNKNANKQTENPTTLELGVTSCNEIQVFC